MTKLSVSAAWDETKAILSRDGRLFVAVALAFVAVPTVIANFVAPSMTDANALAPGSWLIVSFIVLLLIFAGVLALSNLALRHGVTVGDTVSTGFRRLFPFAVVVFVILLSVSFVAAALATQGTATPNPLIAAQLVLLFLVLLSPVVGRLSLIAPVAAVESGGPWTLVRRSWRLSAGSTLKLWGFILLLFGASLILEAVTGLALGVVARILIGPVEPWSTSKLVVAIILALLRAFEAVIFAVMLARIYAQLAGRHDAQPSVPSTGI